MPRPYWLMSFTVLIALASGQSCLAIEDNEEAKERQTAIKMQRDWAEDKLKASQLKMTLGETEDLLVYTHMSADKSARAAAALQKSHSLAAKTLKMDEGKIWKGKLIVFIFPEYRSYKSFILDAMNRSPQGRETVSFDLKGNTPSILIGVALGERPNENVLIAEAAMTVAKVVLNRKAGVGTGAIDFQVPEWLAGSFGRLVYYRLEPARWNSYRSRVRGLYGKTRGEIFKPSNAWDSPPIPELELLQVSFVDYLVFGPPGEKFGSFAQAFKPEDENQPPSISSAMAALEWKAEDLEAGWRKWAWTGK